MATEPQGFESPDIFREVTLVRIGRVEAEIDEIARRINRIIENERLPVAPMPLLRDPGEEDEDCEGEEKVSGTVSLSRSLCQA